jgi:hypothetical protein
LTHGSHYNLGDKAIIAGNWIRGPPTCSIEILRDASRAEVCCRQREPFSQALPLDRNWALPCGPTKADQREHRGRAETEPSFMGKRLCQQVFARGW